MSEVDNLVDSYRELLRFVLDRINWCLDSNSSTTQQFDLTEIYNCTNFFLVQARSLSIIFRCATSIIIIMNMITTISVILILMSHPNRLHEHMYNMNDSN